MRNDITHAYWYHGVISRASAESVLELDGDFLVRASLNNGQEQYVVSCKSRTSFLHIVLLCEQDKYMILEDFEKKDSIEELISTYMDNKHPVSKLSMTILKRPISHLRNSSKRLDNEAPCLDNSQPLDNQSIDKIIDVLNKYDPYKLAKFLVRNEIEEFSKFDEETLIKSERSKRIRAAEIHRCDGIRSFFQALLVLGDLRKSCLLLDQLVLCCYELYQTLKCDSALSHILLALKSETVARHTNLWNKFKKDHIVSFLTYQRILQPISEDRKENRLFLKYQRDCFKLIDDDQFLEDLSIAKMVQLVFDARESHIGSGRQDALAKCRGAIKSEIEGSADSALAKIFSLGYQEKLLLEPGVSVFDETSKKIESVAQYE